jgi:hypothetical protein
MLATTCASAIGLVLVGTPAAFADDNDWYDPSALETSCTEWVDGLGQADNCWFEPSSKKNFTGKVTRVSGNSVNCTDINATKSISWSQSTSETNSISVSVGVEAKLSLIYTVSIKLEYGHSWTSTHTVTATDTAPVPARSVAWIERGEAMQTVTGRMVHSYPKRRHGHYTWYTYPTLTNADPEALDYDTIIFRSRPMTPDEASTLCGETTTADSTAASRPTMKILQQAKPASATSTDAAVPDVRPESPVGRTEAIGS